MSMIPAPLSKADPEGSASCVDVPGQQICTTANRLARVAGGVLRTFCTFVVTVTGLSPTTPLSRMRAVRLCAAVATLRRPL